MVGPRLDRMANKVHRREPERRQVVNGWVLGRWPVESTADRIEKVVERISDSAPERVCFG